VIKREAISDPRTAIMSHNGKVLEAEFLHHGELVGRHRSFRIRVVELVAARCAGIAIAAQIGRDDRKLFGERWCYAVQYRMSPWRTAIQPRACNLLIDPSQVPMQNSVLPSPCLGTDKRDRRFGDDRVRNLASCGSQDGAFGMRIAVE
jgi:hypothetical protein